MSSFSVRNITINQAVNDVVYLQSDNKVTSVVPSGSQIHIDLQNYRVFNVDLSTLTPSSGQNVNYVSNTSFVNATNQYVFYFGLIIDQSPELFPGVEFTVFFNGNSIPNSSSTWISLYVNNTNCDILSPANALNAYGTISVTLKSNGSRYSIIGTGPQAWSFGPYDC